MKTISFDEGFEEYAINGDPNRVIRLRIADANLPQRVEAAMKRTDEAFTKFKAQENPEQLPEFDAEVKAIINEAFGSDICTPAFQGANITTLDKSGRPIFYGFINSLMDILKEETKRITDSYTENIRPEVGKYLETDSKPSAIPDVSGLTAEQKRELLAQLI